MMTDLASWAARWGLSQAALDDLRAMLNPATHIVLPSGQARSEAHVQAELQVEATKNDGALWRNNSGACVDLEGRQVRYGLGNTSAKLNAHFKSSDLIGIKSRLVTSQDVGRTLGVFMAVEVKHPGWKGPTSEREKAQANFLMTVRSMGGIGVFATHKGDVFP